MRDKRKKYLLISLIPVFALVGYFGFSLVDWFSNLETVKEPNSHHQFQKELKSDFLHAESLEYKDRIISIYRSKQKTKSGLILFELSDNFQIDTSFISIEQQNFSEPNGRVYRGSWYLNSDFHFSFPKKELAQKIKIVLEQPAELFDVSDSNDYAKLLINCNNSFSIKSPQESAPFIYYEKESYYKCKSSQIEFFKHGDEKYLVVSQVQ